MILFSLKLASTKGNSEYVASINELAPAIERARKSPKSYLISLVTDSHKISPEGGCWWEVAVPEVSSNKDGIAIFKNYKKAKQQQPY